MLEKLRLRNGSEVPRSIVVMTMSALTELWGDGGLSGVLAVCALKELCLRRTDQVDPATLERLQQFALVEPNGGVPVPILNVVLSSLEGEGLDIALVSPIARLRRDDLLPVCIPG